MAIPDFALSPCHHQEHVEGGHQKESELHKVAYIAGETSMVAFLVIPEDNRLEGIYNQSDYLESDENPSDVIEHPAERILSSQVGYHVSGPQKDGQNHCQKIKLRGGSGDENRAKIKHVKNAPQNIYEIVGNHSEQKSPVCAVHRNCVYPRGFFQHVVVDDEMQY